MPTSAWDGRKWVTDRLADLTPDVEIVVDVGPGRGTYSILGRHLTWWADWHAVEVFEPYVERFLLGELYDHVHVTDVRDWKPDLGPYLILFGDVLEHLPHGDAVDVLQFHLEHAAEVYVSVPIVYSPQAGCYGNDHEAHLHQWGWDEMTGLLASHPGTLESFKGVQVGRWWWKRND